MEKKEIKTRIKIEDLPKDMKVSEKEIRSIKGGLLGLIWKWLGGPSGGGGGGSGVCGVRG